MKKTFGERFAIPQETYSNQSLTLLRGKRSVTVENHYGIAEYTEDRIKIKHKHGSVCVIGSGLRITQMTKHTVEICGSIDRLELE